MIEFTGAKPIPVPIREENGFAFSAEETLKLITPRTRLLIVNSPANPTGGVTPKAEVDKLVAGLENWPDVAIMSDEIYDHMVYDGETHVCLLSYPSIRDRLILLNGWSKTYAMTGWRLGYAVWPGKLYDYARKLAVNLHSCVNASAQYAGLAALKGSQDEVTKMVAEFDKRRKVVVDGLNKLPGVSCATPKGAFYAFPNIKRTGWKAKALASALLEDAGVAIIGGPDFGILGEGYIRVSYANSMENILKALDRMFKNTFADIEYILTTCAGNGTRFEIECYDIGHLYTLRHFLDRGLVKPPLFVQSVFGILGGIGPHPEDVMMMKRTADRLLGDNYHWSVLGAGQNQMRVAAIAAAIGGNVRVGMEDSLWIGPGKLAESNAQQVTQVRKILEGLGLEIASSDEAREILSLKGGDKVAF